MSAEIKNSYQTEFSEVLQKIQTARKQAYAKVNSILLELYWSIGAFISNEVSGKRWGKSVVESLSLFIQKKEPGLSGFSGSNLWRMKQFYETYRHNAKLATLWREISWSNNRRIMTLKNEEERFFYLQLCAKNNYSVRELEKIISSGTFERTIMGEAGISEAVAKLPKSANVFKDSYVFDFVKLPVSHSEDNLQKALVASIKNFILELGAGFTFIGEEYRLQVGNDDFYIDLLLFHRELQSLVAIELKTTKFKPQFMGQLEFYLEALDRNVKLKHENPSIGMLLCREKDHEVVEYALSRTVSPAVIAQYETKLIPKKLLQQKLDEFYNILNEIK